MAREITLTNGMVTLVDDEDFEWLSGFRWYPAKGRLGAVYAQRQADFLREDGTKGRRGRQMQRDILDPEGVIPRILIADHINGNTLDNRRGNLRWATFSESNRNRRVTTNTNGYRGVHFKREEGTYSAAIKVNGRAYVRSGFASAEDAARAYNNLARLHHGEFAVLNEVPDEGPARPGPILLCREPAPPIKWAGELEAQLRALCGGARPIPLSEIARRMGLPYKRVYTKAWHMGLAHLCLDGRYPPRKGKVSPADG